jgi:hypothetical protein
MGLMKFLSTLIFGYSVFAYQLDLSNINRLKQQAVIQSFESERLSIVNSELHVYMKPTDGDGLSGNSRNDDNRQRNEISINIRNCVAKRGETIKYRADIKMINNINWDVINNAWYHIFQIKKWGRNRPLLTIGIKYGKLVLYRCDGYNAIIIGNVDDYWSKWLHINADVIINSDNIKLNYNLNGHSGQLKCVKNISSGNINWVYLKLGQYRSYPNPIKSTTETVYKNIMCY